MAFLKASSPAFLSCYLAALLTMPGFAMADEILFSNVFGTNADGVVLVEVSGKDTLVFDGGNYDTGGSPLVIAAPRVRIDAPTVILSFPLDSEAAPISGLPAGVGTGASGERGCELMDLGFLKIKVNCTYAGGPGPTGNPGKPGVPGRGAGAIDIDVGEIAGTSHVVVIGNGQQGGRGQTGGTGGTGGRGVNGQNRAGDIICQKQNRRLNGAPGGRGGTGGTGGTGGPGGTGAPVSVRLPEGENFLVDGSTMPAYEQQLGLLLNGSWQYEENPAFVVLTVGGRGGEGGARGVGGAGGAGGKAGKDSHCGGGGQPGTPGGRGPQGAPGRAGPVGQPGPIEAERF